jgi:carbamoyl-phosphate synthase large subunit
LEEEIKLKLKLSSEMNSFELLKKAKEYGFSDLQIAKLLNKKVEDIREWRKKLGIQPQYKLVDTCAAEFQAYTPYYYSTYES